MSIAFSGTEVLELLEALVGYRVSRTKRRQAANDLSWSESSCRRDSEDYRTAFQQADDELNESTQKLHQAADAPWTNGSNASDREKFQSRVQSLAERLV